MWSPSSHAAPPPTRGATRDGRDRTAPVGPTAGHLPSGHDLRAKERAVDVLTPMREKLGGRWAPPEEAPPLESGRTIVDLFFDRVERWPERPALRHVQEG